jgi:Fic family protein
MLFNLKILNMEASLQSIIEKINLLHAKVKALSVDNKWDKDFIEKVKIDFTYNSNKLEGNTLTYGETISFLKNITVPQKSQKDLLDIENHQAILDKVFEQFDQPFSVEFIKDIHRELMKDYDQWDYETLPNPGQFKIFENYAVLPSGKIKEYMRPSEVENAMNELINTTNTLLSQSDLNDIKKHPLTIATAFHNRFLNDIHPFQDGNGRIVRIFSNIILLKCGFPPIFIETQDNIEREKYLNTIHESEQKNDLVPMTKFCGKKLIESLERKHSFIQQAMIHENKLKIPDISNIKDNKKSNGLLM